MYHKTHRILTCTLFQVLVHFFPQFICNEIQIWPTIAIHMGAILWQNISKMNFISTPSTCNGIHKTTIYPRSWRLHFLTKRLWNEFHLWRPKGVPTMWVDCYITDLIFWPIVTVQPRGRAQFSTHVIFPIPSAIRCRSSFDIINKNIENTCQNCHVVDRSIVSFASVNLNDLLGPFNLQNFHKFLLKIGRNSAPDRHP